MLTYTGARNNFGALSNNNSTVNLSLGDVLINEGIRNMLGNLDWPFLEKQRTISTTDGTQFYDLPNDCDKMVEPIITVGGIVYRPIEVMSWDDWYFINSATNIEGDNVCYYFIDLSTKQIGFWPTPATTSNTITLTYKRKVRDLSIADYTTGTITTATAASDAIVGSGTSWTTGQEGLSIRITRIAGANGGDGDWYEIEDVASGTAITLTRNYLGQSIAAGSAAYTIGDTMIIPERFQMGPIYWSVAEYWRKEGDAGKADRFQAQYDKLLEEMKEMYGEKTTNVVIDGGDRITQINPNMYPRSLS